MEGNREFLLYAKRGSGVSAAGGVGGVSGA
jgi:hypothetical protein